MKHFLSEQTQTWQQAQTISLYLTYLMLSELVPVEIMQRNRILNCTAINSQFKCPFHQQQYSTTLVQFKCNKNTSNTYAEVNNQ